MKEVTLTLPERGLIAGTRGALGAGLALLLADRMSDEQRHKIGRTLFLIGAISTIPLVFHVLGKSKILPGLLGR